MENQNNSATHFMLTTGRLSLILAPLALIIGWALNYESLVGFFDFNISNPYLSEGKSATTEEFLATLMSSDGGFRHFLLPHYFIYVAMPLFIIASLYLARLVFVKAPWHALIGAALVILGAACFIGVLGNWFAFRNIASVPANSGDMLAVLKALTTVSGVLLVSTILSTFLMLGLIVLGFGLFVNKTVPRWSAALIIGGNIEILAFGGVENWMLLGAAMMLIGLLPLGLKSSKISI